MVPKNVSSIAGGVLLPSVRVALKLARPVISINSLTTTMTTARFALLGLFSLFVSTAAWPQHAGHSRPDVEVGDKAPLLDGLGNLQHPVSTTNAEAQRYFHQ